MLSFKQNIKIFVLKFFHSQKKFVNFYKIFSSEKNFIKSPYQKRRRQYIKIYTRPLSPTTPSHTTKNQFLGKLKKSLFPTLKNNQTSPSHATQETNLWISPHPKNNSPLPIL